MVIKRFLIFLVFIAGLVVVLEWILQPVRASSTPISTTYPLAQPVDARIPQSALRLRIIANSDSNTDQALKRVIRDAVIVKVGGLLQGVQTEDRAQQVILQNVPQLNSLATEVARAHGFQGQVHSVVGHVPFPTKVYGNTVYPAGNYEALRIVIGNGQGQNWWCVLFPPLCFVDITSGDAVPNTGGFPDLPPLEVLSIPSTTGKPVPVQVRLATLDYGEELLKGVRTWLRK